MMKSLTYQQRIEALSNCKTFIELMDKVQPIIDDILHEDEMLYSINKRWRTYGTWEVQLWTNEYRFGKQLSELLMKHKLTTHDEDKIFTIDDFSDVIRECVEEYAYDYWNEN